MNTAAATVKVSSAKKFLASLTLEKLAPAVLILVVGCFVIRLLTRLFEKVLSRSHIEKNAHGFLRSAFRILLYTIVVLMAASSLGFDVTSLIAVLSVISLAFSLAIQGALSNLAGGITVLTTHPFRVGDYVEIGTVSGTVAEIGMSYTKLHTADSKEIFVPNSEITSSKIINYTMSGRRRVDLTFTASYRDSAETVKAALLQAARLPAVQSDPAPFAAVSRYTDSAVEYVLQVWVASEDYLDVYYAITERVRACFENAGIAMAYPRYNIHLDQISKDKES